MGSTWHELAIVLFLSFEDNILHNLDIWLALCKLNDVQVFDSFWSERRQGKETLAVLGLGMYSHSNIYQPLVSRYWL